MTKRRRSQDRISDLPEESVNGISDLPEESVNGISNLPEESANEISNLPEESVNGISNLPEESVNGISNLPEESVNEISNLPEDSVNGISNLPEESVNEISNLPEESVNRISNSPVDRISNLPVNGMSNSPVNRVSNSPLDRISNLPTDIIREIQSYLPWKVGAKFNILSKIWRRIWASHPRIILDEMDFGADYSEYRVSDKAKRVAFLSYLIKLLESRKSPSEYDCDIDKLFLRMTTLEDSPPPKNLVKKWICFALEKNVKLLSLALKTIYPNHYYLHGIAFCSTTLVDLTISDCHITNCSFKLPALKFLFLFVVCIEDHHFKDLIAACPRIEKLRVLDTQKLHTIVVSNPQLKSFGVHLPCSDGKIRIESQNLHSLEFISFIVDLCELEITSTTTVRELTLRKAYHQETVMHFMKKFPLLEKLKIDDCTILSEAEINPLPTVRNLTLRRAYHEETLLNFIGKFPLLEKLEIDDCSILSEAEINPMPTVQKLTLRNVCQENTAWAVFLEKFPLLEKLLIDDCDMVSEFETGPLPTVRNLTLCNVREKYTTWTDFINKFTLLEKLIIADCKLQMLHLSQPNLASLVLMDCIVEDEVQINSSKLKSLEFKGRLTKIKGIEDLKELEFVKVYLDPVRLSKCWYRWFRDILKSCARSKHLSVICNSKKVIINPKYVTDILPVTNMEHLELEIISRHGTFEEVIDDFISILPDLKTSSLTLGYTTKFFQFSRADNVLSAKEVPNPNLIRF
ncbi:uncharacterized protein [Solanum lycopersicum]|uniref:uncharacterized protein n=1 Tax=Solanum lycopersicum TaxID=4081 RepID=UPI0037495DCC